MPTMASDKVDDRGAHETVLLVEAVDALFGDPDGFYVDGTFGRGGHTSFLLDRLGQSGQILAIDRDPEAVRAGRERFGDESRVDVEKSTFSQAKMLLEQRERLGFVDGMLFDLGVSSPQIDNADRGFSFMKSGPLDMRMSPDTGPSAADWLAVADLEEIVHVLKVYGEEKFGRRIATAIIERRETSPLRTTQDLVALIDEAVPVKDPHKHPATRSFQAIRIHVNAELEEVEKMLSDSLDVLAVGGRLVIISFHSLEDRIVKRFMRDNSRPKPIPRDIPILPSQADVPRLKIVGKPIKPGQAEVAANPRARSAIMRIAEKVA